LSQKRVAIVGAGASGIMAACYASENCEVVLFEKEKRIGRKILISGNGRCNISNSSITPDRYHGNNPGFVNNIFGRFSNSDTIDFFSSIGLPLVEKQDGKLFPASLQSSSVVKLLEYELKKRGVKTLTGNKILSIEKQNDKFLIKTSGSGEMEFDSVILCCGSCAYPSVGGTRDGYKLAESMKHSIIKPFPVILPLNMTDKRIRRLQGVKWDCTLRVTVDKKEINNSTGELLFTAYGISGPVTLNVSRSVNENILNGKNVTVLVDFFPDYSEDELNGLLNTIWMDERKKLLFSLYGILKEKMPEVILEMAGINPETRVSDLSDKLKNRIVHALKYMELHPGKPRGFEESVAVAGGVPVDEIDPGTMESKKVKGLFITGELLDIDGDSGGFNLQFAWSTGTLAGMAQCSF